MHPPLLDTLHSHQLLPFTVANESTTSIALQQQERCEAIHPEAKKISQD
jgi:hypothetical protein